MISQEISDIIALEAALDQLDEALEVLEEAQSLHEEIVEETAYGELGGEPIDEEEGIEACAEAEANVDAAESEIEDFCVELRDVINDLDYERDQVRNHKNWRGQHSINRLIDEMEDRGL